ENIPPSIAIEQTNTVRNSRSTVGTMTELSDFFKVWFSSVAELFDPATGEKIEDDTPDRIWRKLRGSNGGDTVLITFRVGKPESLSWAEIIGSLRKQGYPRALIDQTLVRLEQLETGETTVAASEIFVIQDRVTLQPSNRTRFLEAAESALHYGHGELFAFTADGTPNGRFCQGLRSPATGQTFRAPSPALFSFNSPLGACARCRGFGRIIEIDYN